MSGCAVPCQLHGGSVPASLLSQPELPSGWRATCCWPVTGEGGQELLRGMSVQGAAAWLCLNSHLSYTGITTSSDMKVVTGILRSQPGAGVVMATTLHGRFSLLGIELGEQNCLVSSITECGNISDRV